MLHVPAVTPLGKQGPVFDYVALERTAREGYDFFAIAIPCTPQHKKQNERVHAMGKSGVLGMVVFSHGD